MLSRVIPDNSFGLIFTYIVKQMTKEKLIIDD